MNNYVKVLHKPFGEIEFTPYYLFQLKEKSLQHFDNFNHKLPRFDFNNPDMCSIDEWNTAYSKLKEISELLKLVKPISKNPWRLCHPRSNITVDQEEIEVLTKKFMELLESVNSKFLYLAQITGISEPESLNKLDESLYMHRS